MRDLAAKNPQVLLALGDECPAGGDFNTLLGNPLKNPSVGMLQSLAPPIQLALGVMLYGESIDSGQMFGFITTWLALGIYAFDSFRATRPAKLGGEFS